MSVLKKNIGIFCLSFLSAAFLFAADKYNNNIKGYASNILAGTNNTTSGLSSAILNGDRNTVSGQFSTAGGAGSVSNATGTFTWSDSANVIGVWTNNNILNHTWFKTRGGFSVTISTNMADGGLFMRDNYVSIGTTTTPSTFTVNGTMTVFSTVTAAAYAGDGSALVNLNASALSSGTVNDLRLSSNVSLLNSTQTATADKAFSNRVLIGTSTISESTATLTLYGSIRIVDGNEGLGRVLTGIDGAGFGTWRVPTVTGQNIYYLTPYVSDLSGFYYMDVDISSTVAVTTSTWAGIASDVALSSFTTRAGYPGALRMPGGQVTLNLWLAKTGGTKDLSVYANVYRWDGSVRTLLATSELSPYITSTTPAKYTTSASIPNSVDWAASDRLQIIFYAHVTGTGSAPTLQAFKGGTYYEEVQVPAAVINAANYVVKDSSGNVDLDGHNLAATGITAVSLTATSSVTTPTILTSTVTAGMVWADNSNRTEGLISTPTIVNDGVGAISITSTTVLIRNNSAFTGNIAFATVPANASLAMVNNSMNFIYVDYNGGSPIYKSSTTDSFLNSSNYLRVARLYMQDNVIEYILYNGSNALGLASKTYERVMHIRGTNGIELESGFTITEQTGRVIAISSGVVWFGLEKYALNAITSLTSPCSYYTHSSTGGWVETSTRSYINDVYDTPTGTTTLTTNRYAVNYIYGYGKTGKIVIYLGQGDYTLAQANAAAITIPNVAPPTNYFYAFLGSIVVQKGASSATVIYNVSKTAFVANTSTIDASQIVSGVIDLNRIPPIPVSKMDLSSTLTVSSNVVITSTVSAPAFSLNGSTITSWGDVGGGTASAIARREEYIVGTASANYTGSTTEFTMVSTFSANGYVLGVYYDGILMRGAGQDYTETTDSQITFVSPRVVGHTVTMKWYANPVASFGDAYLSGANTWTANNIFTQPISGSITGNAGTVTNGIYTTGGNMTGQLTTASTMTVQGNAFSVGGSTFAISAGTVAIGGLLRYTGAAPSAGALLVSDGSGNLSYYIHVSSIVYISSPYSIGTTYTAVTGSTATITTSQTSDISVTFSGSLNAGQVGNTANCRIIENGVALSPLIQWSGPGSTFNAPIAISVLRKSLAAGTWAYALQCQHDGGTFTVWSGATSVSTIP